MSTGPANRGREPHPSGGPDSVDPLEQAEVRPDESQGTQQAHQSQQSQSTGRAGGGGTGDINRERFVFTPPIDIFETEEGLVLHADLPGVSVETLDLQVQDNKLTLFGRNRPSVPEGARPLHLEYEEGDFLRSFILSDEVDHERITATISNGVLKVVLPRAARAEPRRIEVSSD